MPRVKRAPGERQVSTHVKEGRPGADALGAGEGGPETHYVAAAKLLRRDVRRINARHLGEVRNGPPMHLRKRR